MQDPRRLTKPDLMLVRPTGLRMQDTRALVGWVGVRVPGRQLGIYSGGRALDQRCLGWARAEDKGHSPGIAGVCWGPRGV